MSRTYRASNSKSNLRLVAFFVAVLAVVTAIFIPKVRDLFHERQRLMLYQNQLTVQLDKLKAQNQRLVKEQTQLKDDKYGEQKAREKYGLVKPDEIVFEIKK